MNAHLPDESIIVEYYDSDYPSATHNPVPENFDPVTHFQGVHGDVARHLEIAESTDGPVLELCCGTGRIALPLAERGHQVTAVDVSEQMLTQFRRNFSHWDKGVRERITLVHQDVTCLELDTHEFGLCIIGFNSLLCILDLDAQIETLRRAGQHLRPSGLLVLDVINPLQMALQGNPLPKPFFSRVNTHTRRRYTRFAMSTPVDTDQRQRLHGWYDETDNAGRVHRTPYSMQWRPVFRYELELMLRVAGLELVSIEGGHRYQPFTAQSPHMFVQARRH